MTKTTTMRRLSTSLRISVFTSMALSALIATFAVVTYRIVADPKVVVVQMPAPAPPPIVQSCPPAPPPPPVEVRAIPVGRGDDDTATLAIGSLPFAEVFVDGRHLGNTPLYGPRAVTIGIGKHRIEFVDRDDRSYRYDVVIGADDPRNKLIVLLGKHEPPRALGAVSASYVGSAGSLSEERAATLFEEAVDRLRARDDGRACGTLQYIMRDGPTDSVWTTKSGKLFSRRCDDDRVYSYRPRPSLRGK